MHAEPVELLVQLNQILYNDLPKNSFFTLSYLLLNLKKKSELIRTGHTTTLLFKANNGGMKILEPSGIGLGLEKGEVFRKKLKKIKDTFQPGDIFLLYTDGVTETFN